jgi:hypothetical protein
LAGIAFQDSAYLGGERELSRMCHVLVVSVRVDKKYLRALEGM